MSDKIFDKDLIYRAKVRVKAGTDEIIVRPEAKGQPAKKDVVERGESQMYTTTGKRNPKRVIQLMTPEKSGDLIGDMKKQFDESDYSTEISNLEGELRRCLLSNRTSLLSASRAQ